MRLLPKSIHWCRRYPTKFNSGRDIPPPGLAFIHGQRVRENPPLGLGNDVCSAPMPKLIKDALSRTPPAFRWWQRGLRLGIFMLILWTVVGTIGFI